MRDAELLGRPLAEGRRAVRLENGRIELRTRRIERGWLVTGTVRGRPGRVELARVSLPREILLNNWQSWGPLAKVRSGERPRGFEKMFDAASPYLFTPVPDMTRLGPVSDDLIAWRGGLAGFAASRTAFPCLTAGGDSAAAILEYAGAEFEDPVALEPFLILQGDPVEDLLDDYADSAAAAAEVRPASWNPVGWCSWYHYFRGIEWPDVLENLEAAAGRWPFEVFQLDDGYQSEIGDWLDLRPGFPSLPEMARKIRAAGFIPGIWTAPFSVAESSRLFQRFPEWLVSEEGRPKFCYNGWGRKIYALDASREDVRAWLFRTFRFLQRAGFGYFKIDFLFAGSIPGVRARGTPPVAAYRQGLRTIREATKGSFLLGCGAPLLASAGLVDGMRIGEDTAPFWDSGRSPFHGPNAVTALRNALMRQFLHRRLWLNDPDCLLLRSREIDLTEEERGLYALTAGTLDNLLFDSDRLALVDDGGQALFRRAIALRGGRPRVRGLLDEDFLIESGGGPAGPFRLAVNLEEDSRKIAGRPVPARSAVFLDGAPLSPPSV
jgi:alpha-galactosidase